MQPQKLAYVSMCWARLC